MAEPTDLLAAALAGRYRIVRRLGEGGMATVYLADDLKHDRQVALKVLKPELAVVVGAERFLQEIKTTARLQHPHILPLYDSGSTAAAPGEGSGFLFYVMPFVEGETLRQKLDREQQLGVDEAVRIAGEVADALEYAHQQGVIHRDIKPENILLRDGRALVADFGIALAVSAAGGGRLTETGLSLGTPHYMSPEQATAERQLTNRSDVYALGAVLYELLAGEPPHSGPSAQAIIMKIVADVPRPVEELRKTVPPHVAAAVAKALEKLPADRFESAKAFAAALRDPEFTATVTTGKRAAARLATRPLARPVVLAGALAVAASVAFGAWGWLRPRGDAAVARHVTSLGETGRIDGITFGTEAALAPDGSALVFRSPLRGPGQLWIKRRDEVTPRPLPGTEGGSGPFFSPDGAWIGFVAGGQMRRIPTAGGESLTLTDSVHAQYNRGAWLDDGTIIYYDPRARTLRRLDTSDGSTGVIVSREMVEGRFPWLPSPLPGSRGFLFTAHQTNCVGPVSCRPSRVYVYDARRDTVRALFDDAIGAWHVPTGHVLYLTSGGTLMAAPWDDKALEPKGRAVAVMDGIQAPGLLVANDGTAYYLQGHSEFAPGPLPNAQVVWIDRTGRTEPVDSTWQVNTGGTFDGFIEVDWGLSLSPDGKRIAITQLTEFGTDIWIKPLPSGPATRLTLHGGMDRAPAWTTDGKAITYLSDRTIGGDSSAKANALHLWEQPADGIGAPRVLWDRELPTDAFRGPDGRWTVVAKGARVTGAVLSPDRRWLAYVSDEQGTSEVFVRPYPDVNAGRWQISSGGGSAPVWAHSGRELFYVADRTMHAVRIDPGPPFSAGPPRALFALHPDVRAGSREGGTFAMSLDDRRFLMVKDNDWLEMAGTPTLVAVQGFLGELRGKVKP